MVSELEETATTATAAGLKVVSVFKAVMSFLLEVLDTSSISLGERFADEQWKEVRLKRSQHCLCQ